MRTVLIIDDDRIFLRMYQANFAFYRHVRVLTATSGEEGLRLARAEKPDLVLVDYRMPAMSGAEVTRRLRESPATARIPIVLVTSHSEESEVDDAVFDEFVPKPIKGDKITDLARRYLPESTKTGNDRVP